MAAQCERQFGPRFDIRDFRAEAPMTGALLMVILEQKIDDWCAEPAGRWSGMAKAWASLS